MQRSMSAIALVAMLFGQGAAAQNNSTVVELFTSQGCSSCPAADKILAQLATRSDVIPLALHVDYWDYLGWKDDLASPAFTQRQHGYAAALGSSRVYTPQMVVGGVDDVVGSHGMEVMDLIQRHNAAADPVTVALSRSGNALRIEASGASGPERDALVQVVRYTPHVVRDIKRGENAGRTVDYVNTVWFWQVAGTWNTGSPLAMTVTVEGADPVVVIVQEGANGPILGAAALR